MTGWPVLLFLRRVVEEAQDFDEALAWLTRQRLAVGALITLAGRENAQRVVVERAPNDAALRWARGDEPLVTTNHYRALDAQSGALVGGLDQTACRRWERLTELAGGWRGRDPEDAEVLRALQDPGVQQEITAQHVLMDPVRGVLRIFVPRRLLPGGAKFS
ncbi:MAG: carcinine hydrolase/isopenicillin-N N-acyltransferase family protein [Planctomycetes bacterium]|nr:carcinine hydrolase/isopenicillin-N N-acyltransferase family protein [Planctomycetota bacterium]